MITMVAPKLELIKEKDVKNKTYKYVLRSTIVLNQPNLISGGLKQPIPTTLDKDVLKIDLLVQESASPASSTGSSTIIHNVELGTMAEYGITDIKIDVSVYDHNLQLRGNGHVRTAAAKEIGKPIMD